MSKEAIRYEKAVFDEIYAQTSPKIFRYFLSLCNDAQDAEDLLQETYLSVYKSLDSFKKESSVSTWVYRIATNKFRDHLRKKKKTGIQNKIEDIHALSEITPEDLIIAKDNTEKVQKALNELPPNLKAVLYLVKMEEMKYREAAIVLDTSLSSVRMQIYRAVQLLTTKLKEVDFE